MKTTKHKIELSNSTILDIETGKLAKQADGAVLLQVGKTMLLTTVVSKKEEDSSKGFLPLSVDYQEKYAANGKIPGGFLKREGPLKTNEILISRLIDRALRPLFPKFYFSETQVNIFLVSGDSNILPDSFACIAASAALLISDIPFTEPVAEVRVGRINGQWIINPTAAELKISDIDLMIGGTLSNILMVEGECNEVSEEELLEALEIGHKTIKEICHGLNNFVNEAGIVSKRKIPVQEIDFDLRNKVFLLSDKVDVLLHETQVKKVRENELKNLFENFIGTLSEAEQVEKKEIAAKHFHDLIKETMRGHVLTFGKRLDGRKLNEIRIIDCEVNYLPGAHGSSLFTRGETQSLTTVTLGTSRDEQMIEGALTSDTENFMLQYNFPGFCTGEVKFNRAPGRREIGHGNLAQRSLKKVIPKDFPYTIRVVSDILESNGSSSMATVCAGSLALMDTGVPIKSPVAGIAMGLITDGNKFAILSDISGDEDHLGDMDFKVTGTEEGICACQMDIKTTGISYKIFLEALLQAKEGRIFILSKMNGSISAPRSEFKTSVPRVERLTFPKEFIGALIGPGGKVIQELQKSTGTTLIVKEEGEIGVLEIFAPDEEKLADVKKRVVQIIAQPVEGEVYEAIVKSIVAFGAFVEILPGKEGLVHISEIASERVEKIEGVLKIGDKVKVKLLQIDSKSGKLKLSIKALLQTETVPAG